MRFIITTVNNPLQGVEALVIAGSDRRGTIYGVYELAEQMVCRPGIGGWMYLWR